MSRSLTFGDTVWVIVSGEIREGEIRGTYYNGGTEETDSWGVWMTTKSTGQSPFKMFTFYKDQIFTDIDKAKKAVFKSNLRGTNVYA